MKYFDANGLWFPADDPSNAVGGNFRFSPKGLKLVLIGSFREGWSPVGDVYPVVHGVVAKNPYGSFVTIFNGRRTSSSIHMSGIVSDVIVTNQAILGDTHLADRDAVFHDVEFELTYGTEWFGRKGIEFSWPAKGQCEVRATIPETVELPVKDGVIKIGMSAQSSHSAHRAEISERAEFIFVPDEPTDVTTFLVRTIRPVQDLLTFATDRPNSIEEVKLKGKEDDRPQTGTNRSYHHIFDPLFKSEGEKQYVHQRDMLFTFDDTERAGINIFAKWDEFRERHAQFCNVYFATVYTPPRFVDVRFSRMMAAFSLLGVSLGHISDGARRLLDGLDQLVKEHFPAGDVDLVVPALPTAGEVDTPFILRRLLEENTDLMGQVIDGSFEDFARMVAGISAQVHWKAQHGTQRYGGGQMLGVLQRVQLLIKIVILGELGFDRESVKSLVQRNDAFSNLKAFEVS